MNLTEALDVALPELPARRALRTFPKLHPKLVAREHVEEGAPVVIAHIPGTSDLYRFSPEQWAVIQLFDGRRSYAQISEAHRNQSGVEISEAEISAYAEMLQEAGFWYQTPAEKYQSQTQAERKRTRVKSGSRFGDLARIHFSAWDPDVFLTRIYPRLKFLYSGWFTALTLLLFVFMTYVFIDHWDEIGRDTLLYYSFTQKSFSDLAEFWLLFFALGFFHESAHGLTCKHYGGGVHRMGFQLLYLTPTFFVEVTEGWVYAERKQRLAIIIAGIWVELIFCSLATTVWWGTAPGVFAHEFAYKVMLITGVAVVVVNLNPLIKLDGYYFFCEALGVSDIKERSTSFVSSWVKRNIFGLPVEREYVSRRRAWLYVLYALLSGAYSYLLLLAVARFAYNVLRNYSPEWAFVPALYLLYLMFRSRLQRLVTFMKSVYLDKKERIRTWSRVSRLAAVTAVAGLILFAPLWRQSVQGRFVLEPARRAFVRAEVPGKVTEVLTQEGYVVAAGAVMARLHNLALESQAAQALADFHLAAARATQAQLRYGTFGAAANERTRLAEQSRTLDEQVAKLQLVTPVSGTVVTPRMSDALGSYVQAGTLIAEVADLSELRARVYVPESSMREVGQGAGASVKLDALVSAIPGQVVSIAPASTEIEPGLVPAQEYKGIRPPAYYAVTVLIGNVQGSLREGMSGTARIYSTRRSLAGFAWREVQDFLGRKIW